MIASQAAARNIKPDTAADFDAVIIGAGVSGVYQLYKLCELGMRVRVFETGTSVGGTSPRRRPATAQAAAYGIPRGHDGTMSIAAG